MSKCKKKSEIRNIRQDKNIHTRYYKTEDFLQTPAIITKWYRFSGHSSEGNGYFLYVSGV